MVTTAKENDRLTTKTHILFWFYATNVKCMKNRGKNTNFVL